MTSKTNTEETSILHVTKQMESFKRKKKKVNKEIHPSRIKCEERERMLQFSSLKCILFIKTVCSFQTSFSVKSIGFWF